MSKSFVWGFIAGVVLLIVAGVGASRLQDKNARLKAEDEKRYQIEVVDATPVQLGVLTEQQRIHSKHFAYYKRQADSLPIYSKISEFFVNPRGKVMETIVCVGLTFMPESETAERFFSDLAQKSDAIIRGKATRKVSQITEDDAFIFTDYDVVVTEIYKDNAAAPLELEKTITVTRPGGKVVVNGIVGKATDECFTPLPLNHDVVLFLKFIPETGAYKATQDTGSFELDGAKVRPLTEDHFPFGVIEDRQSLLQIRVIQDAQLFLQTVRTVSNK